MLTTIIKTKNSEETISEVLESVKDLGEIVVIDEHSNDDTILLSKEYKAKIIYSSALDFIGTLNQAMEEAQNDWILFIEGNEIIPDKLAQNILNYIEAPKKNKNAVYIAQKLFYTDKEIKACRCLKLKLFKKGSIELQNNISEFKPLKTKKFKLSKNFKQNKDCILKFEKRNIFSIIQDVVDKNIIKSKDENIKNTSIILKPIFKFLYFYLIKGAIFDGKKGFIYSIIKFIDCFIFEYAKFEKNSILK